MEDQITVTKEEVLAEIKANLQTAYLLSKIHAKLIGNNQMFMHVGAIANKWLGGIETTGIAEQVQATSSNRTVIRHNKESFKKKPGIKRTLIAQHADEDLSLLSISELKMKAADLGINIKGMDADRLIEAIKFFKRSNKQQEIIAEETEVNSDDSQIDDNTPTEDEPDPLADDAEDWPIK